jgi:DNA-binding NarL/FixJ family response regulator
MVSVLLADDHDEFLATVVRHLEPHFDVVGTVGDGQALVDEAVRLAPDVVVLDITMPVVNGIDAARKLKATGSRARIVFLTVHADPDYVCAALDVGALGYVLKSELASDLLPCLEDAVSGRSFVSRSACGKASLGPQTSGEPSRRARGPRTSG